MWQPGVIVRTEPARHSDKPVRVVGLQVFVTLAMAALGLIWGGDAAVAVFLGGAVVFLPNAYFAWAILRTRVREEGQPARQIAALATGRLLGQWLAKIALTVALMMVVLAAGGMASLGFFVGLSAALLAQLAAPLVAR